MKDFDCESYGPIGRYNTSVETGNMIIHHQSADVIPGSGEFTLYQKGEEHDLIITNDILDKYACKVGYMDDEMAGDWHEKHPGRQIPPATCQMCGGIITGDNFNESQGVLIHQSCYDSSIDDFPEPPEEDP